MPTLSCRGVRILCFAGMLLASAYLFVAGGWAFARNDGGVAVRMINGLVQNKDLRRVGQALVEVRNQEGEIVVRKVTNDAGEFTVAVPAEGTYSVSAVLETYRS